LTTTSSDFFFYLSASFPFYLHHKTHNARSMESLSETDWDVVISGTGLQQSILAL
jgi:hypothetical protein